MNIELQTVASTDRTVRIVVLINGENTGELQLGRAEFTKIADRLFEGEYRITSSEPVPPKAK